MLEILFVTTDQQGGFVYHAHPNFRCIGANYNWAKINFGTLGNTWQREHRCICPIIAFIKHPNANKTNAKVYSVLVPPDSCRSGGTWRVWALMAFTSRG